MTRLQETFRDLRASGTTGLIPYLVAGDPDPARSARAALAVADAGVHALELGIPWSDPVADGPANQAAMMRALDGGMTTLRALDMVAELRARLTIPIVVMTYANPLARMGFGRFLEMAKRAGVDGLLITDLPPEEAGDLDLDAAHAGIARVYLHAPTTPESRAPLLLARSTGFLYVVARLGVTGERAEPPRQLAARLDLLAGPELNPSAVPLVVGFGIRNRADVVGLGGNAAAAVVGSAFSRTIAEALTAGNDVAGAVRGLARELLGGVAP